MTLLGLGVGNHQATGYIRQRTVNQSNGKVGFNTFSEKVVESEPPSIIRDNNSISIRPSNKNILQGFFRHATPINEAELLEDHFTKSSAYEKMVDSTTGVTYYKNKTKPEMQMTPDQAAKFYEFFGDDTMALINRLRELSGTRKVYGDYRIELLGTSFDRVAIINHKDNSILEFDISGNPNDLFSELDKFLEGRKLSFDLFTEFLGKFNDDSEKQKNIDSTEQKEETSSEVFINPKGERVLMIKTSVGVRYMKIGEATDFLLTDNKNSANIGTVLENTYDI